MCRSIKVLRGAEPRATEADVRAAALQFVRKVSGFRAPSRRNAVAFDQAVEEITGAAARLLTSIESAEDGNRDGKTAVRAEQPPAIPNLG